MINMLPVPWAVNGWDMEVSTLMHTSYVNFQLYGETGEQTKMQGFVDFIEKKQG
jgi:hypothetical protein